MITNQMAIKSENEIIKRLERIENLLSLIIKSDSGLTEEKVLQMAREGDREYQDKKTMKFDDFIANNFSNLN